MTTYKTPKHAWLWTCYLFRLSQITDDDKPLVIEPHSAGLSTLRLRMFQGRQYLETTKQDDLGAFSSLSVQTVIKVFENKVLHIYKKDAFNHELTFVSQSDWFVILSKINSFALDANKSTLLLQGKFHLSGSQIAAMVTYLEGYKHIKTAAVQTESIMLRK